MKWDTSCEIYCTYQNHIDDIIQKMGSVDYSPEKPSHILSGDHRMLFRGTFYSYNYLIEGYTALLSGITHSDLHMFYRAEVGEMLILDSKQSIDYPEQNARIGIMTTNGNEYLASIDLSSFPKVVNIIATEYNIPKIALLEDGSILVLSRGKEHYSNREHAFLKFLRGDDSLDDYYYCKPTETPTSGYMIDRYYLKHKAYNLFIHGDSFGIALESSKKGTYLKGRIQETDFSIELLQKVQKITSMNNGGMIGLLDNGTLTGILNKDYQGLGFSDYEFSVKLSSMKNSILQRLSVKPKGLQTHRIVDFAVCAPSKLILIILSDPNEPCFNLIRGCILSCSPENLDIQICKQLRMLRLRKDARLPTQFINSQSILIDGVIPDEIGQFHISQYSEDIRLKFTKCETLRFPFCTYLDASAKKLIALNIEGECKSENIPVSEVKIRVRARINTNKLASIFKKSSTMIIKYKKEENKKQAIKDRRMSLLKKLDSNDLLRCIPNYQRFNGIEGENRVLFATGVMFQAASKIIEIVDKFKIKKVKEEKERLDARLKSREKKEEQKAGVKGSIFFVFNHSNVELKTPISTIIESSLKYHEVDSSVDITEESKEKFSSSEYCLDLEKCKLSDSDILDLELASMEIQDYLALERRPSTAVVFQGTPRKKFQEIILPFTSINSPEKESIVYFMPDIHRMNRREWIQFKASLKPLMDIQVSDTVLIDETKDDVPSNRKVIEVKINSKLKKHFKEYRDWFISKSFNVRDKDYITKISQFSSIMPDSMGEIRNCNIGVKKWEYLNIYGAGLLWFNLKVWRHLTACPSLNGPSWELDRFKNCKQNIMKTLNASRLKSYGDYKHEYYIDRYGSENSSFEKQFLTLLNQYFSGALINDACQMRRSNTSSFSIYGFKFKGESGIDAGGPSREFLHLVTVEMIEKLKLLVPSANQIENIGEERSKYIPNPYALSTTDLHNFFKLGYLMAATFKCGEVISLDLPSILYKYILNYPISWKDIRSVNQSIFSFIEGMENMSEEHFSELDFKFTLLLQDGSEIELKPNGKTIDLDWDNKHEYIDLVKKRTFGLFMPAFKQIKAGFYTVLTPNHTRFLTPIALELELTGLSTISIEQLKKITVYNYFEENHDSAQMFWRVLSRFSQSDLRLYLKYVWGRTRLSPSTTNTHKLSYYQNRKGIPTTHTCFFELDIGDYVDDEEFERLLRLGMENCDGIAEEGADPMEIDADWGIQE